MRRADDRREPCSGHAVQSDVAGCHGRSGCGQNHDALLSRTAFLPFCFAVFPGFGSVEHRFAGQGLSHVEEEGVRPCAFGDGLQVKTQPAGARACGKGFRPESREFLIVFRLRHLVNVHGGGGIGQDAQVGSENKVLVSQDRGHHDGLARHGRIKAAGKVRRLIRAAEIGMVLVRHAGRGGRLGRSLLCGLSPVRRRRVGCCRTLGAA